MDNFFDPKLIVAYLPKLLACLDVTLIILVSVTLAGMVLSLLIATFRLFDIPVLKQLSIMLTSYARNTPIVIQMFIIYYGLPLLLNAWFGININTWDKLVFVIVAYTINSSAFFSEAIRTAVLSIDPGQMEAAYSVGMSRLQAYRRIILPQAFVIAFPIIGINISALMRDTSIAYAIGVMDVVGQAKAIGGRSFHTLEAYVGAAIIFIILSLVFEKLFSSIEDRLGRKYRTT
ncbi:amino acid ABC transporter permease [Paenibacillus sp. N3.4]|uniref:amino acid ABC transporter permease n=1 Tax=Paenibacillus sp. N3.4 TaxID=2603222 RepID=UPI0011CAB49F|nr:amino acid ABC transporter permease [Paenibacillus sp. N3.4]TXK83873.1 amino acid ABC transporter permease [Paenibacillus sp. N3.4]